MLDENGVTEPFTAEEHAYLVSIPIFTCAARIQGQSCPVCDDGIIPPPDDAPLEGEALLQEVARVFEDDAPAPPAEEAPDDAEAQFEDLLDAWQGMDESERCETVSTLEECGADGFLLRALFNFEAKALNGPRALAAIDTAIGHLQDKRTPEQINQKLLKSSAAGKITTKNPPSKPRR